MNKFTIVIPSRNVTNLKACVKAIAHHDPGHRTIILDDGLDLESTAEFREWLLENTIVVRAPRPFIWSRNVNLGIELAGGDDIVLMNDDAILKTPGGLGRLAEAAQTNGHSSVCQLYGAVSPLIDGAACASDQVLAGSGVFDSPGVHPFDPECTRIRRCKHHMLAFVCVYLTRAWINVLKRDEDTRGRGPFDERYIGYGYDDDDACFRLTRRHHAELGVFDGCVVEHGSFESTFRAKGRAGVIDFPDQVWRSAGPSLLAHNNKLFEEKTGGWYK